jgi:hypothetical protein
MVNKSNYQSEPPSLVTDTSDNTFLSNTLVTTDCADSHFPETQKPKDSVRYL